MRKRRLSRFQLDALVVIEINKHGKPYRVQNEAYRLLKSSFAGRNAVVIEISDPGQVDDPFVGMDIRNIRYPFGVGNICCFYFW